MKVSTNKLRIKWKIFAFMLMFSAALLVILWIFQTVLLKDMYKAIRKREIQKSIEYVEKNINTTDIRSLFKYISVKNDIIVTPTREFIMPDHTQPPPPEQHNQKGKWEKRQISPEVITEEKVFTKDNGEQVRLTFYAMITPVNATVTTLLYQLYFITAIMIGLSIFLAFYLAKKISKPIEDINISAKILAAGNYEIFFDGNGYLEVSELSDTLNTAARELNKTESLRRELLANISHDLRTPLSLIYSYAEMMHDFPDEIMPEQTQVIMDETKRLSSLVNDVFDISKLESGTQQLAVGRFNLTESLKKTVSRIDELVKKEGYKISFEYSNEVYVVADEVKIMQVFYNLLLNAIHYSGEGREIEVKQICCGKQVRVEVIDHGEGIEEKDYNQIWDRYYKIDKTHKRAVTGTGLGLSIVKNIMKLHDGDYGVTSKLGEGSVFWFSLTLTKN